MAPGRGPPPHPLSTVATRALVTALRAGSAVAQAVPEPVARGVADVAAAGFFLAMPARRRTMARHMRRVLGPAASPVAVQRHVWGGFRSSARYWLEAFRLPGLSDDAVRAGFVHDGYEHLQEGLAAGRGVIMAVPHLGGWEWAGRWLATHGLGPTVVVEALEAGEVFEWFAAFRREQGMDVVALGPDAGTAVMRALRDNRIVCLLSDRDVGGGGVEVGFFGERTRLPAGPATLALRTGARIVPTAVYFDPVHGHRAVLLAPLDTARRGRLRDDVARVTQDLAAALEELIRAAPDQWHVYQPNWPSDPGYRG